MRLYGMGGTGVRLGSCYRNAALAWRMTGQGASGRALLLQAAEPDHHVAAEVHAFTQGMGLEGPEAADCR